MLGGFLWYIDQCPAPRETYVEPVITRDILHYLRNGPGQLQLPHGVAIDSKGRLLVSDSDNKRIAVFDKDGKFVENWAAPCRGNIVITRDDTIYVSDVNAGAVTILKDGKIIDAIHVEGRPHGMAVDPTTLDVYTSSSVAQSPNVTKSTRKKPSSN